MPAAYPEARMGEAAAAVGAAGTGTGDHHHPGEVAVVTGKSSTGLPPAPTDCC